MQLNNLIGLFIQRLEAGQQPKSTSLLAKVINNIMNSSRTAAPTSSSPESKPFPKTALDPRKALASSISPTTPEGCSASSLSKVPSRNNSTTSHSSAISTTTASSFSYREKLSSHGSEDEYESDSDSHDIFNRGSPKVEIMNTDDSDSDSDYTEFNSPPPQVKVIDGSERSKSTSQA